MTKDGPLVRGAEAEERVVRVCGGLSVLFVASWRASDAMQALTTAIMYGPYYTELYCARAYNREPAG